MFRPKSTLFLATAFLLCFCADGFQVGFLIRALRSSARVPGRQADLRTAVCSSVCERSTTIARPLVSEPRQRRPNGYWKVFENVESEIMQVVETLELDGIMPTEAQLRKQNLSSLSDALHEMGGYAAVAAKLGLKTSKPKGYWLCFENVVAELKTFLGETVQAFPTQAELRKAGRTDLISAMQAHGGMQRFAEHLELKMSEQKVRATGFSQLLQLDDEILRFSNHYGIEGVMPSERLLLAWGREDIVYGIHRHGGLDHMAKRTRLAIKRSDCELDEMAGELRHLARSMGHENVLPTVHELITHGRGDLAQRIQKKGYIESACLLGMRAVREINEAAATRRTVREKAPVSKGPAARRSHRELPRRVREDTQRAREEAHQVHQGGLVGECMLGSRELGEMKEKIKSKLLSRTSASTTSVWQSLL